MLLAALSTSSFQLTFFALKLLPAIVVAEVFLGFSTIILVFLVFYRENYRAASYLSLTTGIVSIILSIFPPNNPNI